MIDKNEAINLRKQGHSYKDIATMLCCSEVWCKKNLKGIEKGADAKVVSLNTKLEVIAILEDALKRVRAI